MLSFLMPAEVRRNFMIPLLDDFMGIDQASPVPLVRD
jgi:hypothetical protein